MPKIISSDEQYEKEIIHSKGMALWIRIHPKHLEKEVQSEMCRIGEHIPKACVKFTKEFFYCFLKTKGKGHTLPMAL